MLRHLKNARTRNSQKGFTIVELVITMAILLIAISLGFTYISYVSRSQSLVERQSNVQQNVITAKNIIDKSLRQAGFAVITDSAEEAPSAGWNQAFYLVEIDGNGTIMQLKSDGTEAALLGSLAEGYNMQLHFRKIEPSFLEVSITCDIDGENEYNITSEILILGIEPSKFLGTSGSRVYFR